MDISLITEQFKTKAANIGALGATFKFVIDDQAIYIDGTGDENVVSNNNEEADCTVTTSVETLQKLKDGELNPMMAVMGGKIQIKGDMGLAMKLQSLI